MSVAGNKSGKSLASLHADAKRAFLLVVNAYVSPSGFTRPLEHIHRLFHFVEANRWAYYLRYIAYFKVPKENAVNVEAVTHSYGNNPKIGINKSNHSFATLVHESVHFFSHHAFRKAFGVKEYEGATEYLTRHLLQDFGPRRDMHGNGDIYARELAPFICFKTNDEFLQLLCKAYFTGDASCIELIKHRLKADD